MTPAEKERDLINQVRRLKAELKEVEDRLSDHVLEQSPYRKGEVWRDKDTGAQYRIERAYAFEHSSLSHINLVGRRVYSTGRAPATATTTLSTHRLEKVP